jgi:CBS domain containing-hemolysin-like protein
LAYYHTINLHFQSEDGSHHNFFTTIDSSDIDDLIEQLQAAKERIILVNDKYGDGIIQL